MTETPLVTIAMVPRERFSLTQNTLESVYGTVTMPFELVCVDAGSPPEIRDYLAAESRRRGFRVIRTEHYIIPNAARNLALATVRTKYVIFIDNDVVFAPGCIDRLVAAAEETGADVCGPIICIGRPVHTKIHSAFGLNSVVEARGRRYFHETNPLEFKLLSEVGPLQRQISDRFEFHCVLFKRDIFERAGTFDEGLKATSEHQDIGLSIVQAGGKCVFEPGAVMTYVTKALQPVDIGYFDFRWRFDHVVGSEAYFHRKWNLVNDDFMMRHFLLKHRSALWPHLRGLARLRIGPERARIFLSKLRLGWRYRVLPRLGLGPVASASTSA
jgi:GT2 family glycosyltransferase